MINMSLRLLKDNLDKHNIYVTLSHFGKNGLSNSKDAKGEITQTTEGYKANKMVRSVKHWYGPQTIDYTEMKS